MFFKYFSSLFYYSIGFGMEMKFCFHFVFYLTMRLSGLVLPENDLEKMPTSTLPAKSVI